MSIAIDLDITYYMKRSGRIFPAGIWLNNAKEINGFREELEKMNPDEFVEARILHKQTNVDKIVRSRDELIKELYKYLFYSPLGNKASPL